MNIFLILCINYLSIIITHLLYMTPLFNIFFSILLLLIAYKLTYIFRNPELQQYLNLPSPSHKGNLQHIQAILCAQGSQTIQSNHDSFYQIQDSIKRVCSHSQVQTDGQIIRGKFIDCQNVTYQIRKRQMELEIRCIGQGINRLYVDLGRKQNQTFTGLGQQFSDLILKDQPYSLFVREKGVGRGDQPISFLSQLLYGKSGYYYSSYAPSPVWITNQNRGFIVDNHNYIIFHSNRIFQWSNHTKIIILQGEPKQIVKKISQLLGQMKSPPQWIQNGIVLGLQGGTQQVKEKYKKAEKYGVSVAGLWLQDWVGKRQSLGYSRLWWNWQLDQQHYPKWNQLVDLNISLLIYFNPMLTPAPSKKHNLYKAASQKGYFLNYKGKQFQTSAFSDFYASMIDFQNQNATKWFKQVIKNAIKSTSAKGMMVDFGQASPIQPQTAQIKDKNAIQFHNLYPNLWQQKVQQAIKEMGISDQFFTFSRASYLNRSCMRSLWAGDQNMNFQYNNGLRSCLIAMLSASISGYKVTHCDIGGYVSTLLFNRNQDFMIKHLQLSSLSAIMRSHQGNNPQELQLYSSQSLLKYTAYYSKIYKVLKQYRRYSYRQNLPLMRSFGLQLNDHWEVDDQYFLGQHLMVAPFLQANVFTRRVVIPKAIDGWVNIWSGQVVKSGEYEMSGSKVKGLIFINKKNPFFNEIVKELNILVNKF